MRPHPIWIKPILFVLVSVMVLVAQGTWQADTVRAAGGEQTVTLQIEGMTCGSCVKDVRAALQKVPGVKMVDMKFGTKWGFMNDYADAKAIVTFDPSQAAIDTLVKAVESASSALSTYRARALGR